MPDLPLFLSRTLINASPLGRQQRLSTLIYHRVVKERDWMRPAEPTAAEFAWQMQLVKSHFNILPLGVATQMLKQGILPPRAACVTFDDGYADNALVALPVLQRLGIPATVFVATGYIDGGRMWNDTIIESLRNYPGSALDLSSIGLPVYLTESRASRRQAAHDVISRCKYLDSAGRDKIAEHIARQGPATQDRPMLTTDQLRSLYQQGVEIGGHTVSHPILSTLAPDKALAEILRGKVKLEEIIDAPVCMFAYPNGRPGIDYTDEHVSQVRKAGFIAAMTTCRGVSTIDSDPFQLPRFTPWDKSSAKFLLRMALNSRHTARENPGDPQC